ncbi:MAG: LTA synthase family protein [Sarcina sp.]
MQILTYLITGIIIGLLGYFIFDRTSSKFTTIKNFLVSSIGFNILSLASLKFIFKKEAILTSATYTLPICFKYAFYTLILSIILLAIKALLTGKILIPNVKFNKNTKKEKKIIILKALATVFFAIGMIFIFFSTWFIEYFGEITPEQFLFNLKSPLKGTSSGMTTEILTNPVFAILITTIVFLIILNFKYDVFIKVKGKSVKFISNTVFLFITLFASIIALVGGVTYGINKLSLDQVMEAYFSDSSYIKENYVNPNDTEMIFPEKKRNLIHIYLESVENSYFSEDLGGHMKTNLMPELYELAKEGISFTNTENSFGGPYQTYGSSWSVASMINMGSGLPLKTPMSNNSYGKNGSFLPGVITIGDILEQQGYNQTIMFGADADFGGLTTYFQTHGDFNIFDYKAAKEKGLIPEDYYVWWGYEDDKLYEYAKDELTRLANENKPFNFTMETADTHFPDGYLSEKAPIIHDKPYANVISYSTKEAVDFIRWIQKQPFYENTTIVVTGDHLSMDRNFFTDFNKDYQRTVFNLILNSPIEGQNMTNRHFAPFDMFPTILRSMNVDIKGNKLGLGTDLFSGDQTLIEKDSLKTLNDELNANSNFFMDEFIDEKKDSIFNSNLVTYK